MATLLIEDGAISGMMQAQLEGRSVTETLPADYANYALIAKAFAARFLTANAALVAPMADADNARIGQLIQSVCAGVLSGRGFTSTTAADYAIPAAACAAAAKQCVAQLV